jgi:hypothetical protein
MDALLSLLVGRKGKSISNGLGRVSGHDIPLPDVRENDGHSSDDGSSSDLHSGANKGAGADPNVRRNFYGFCYQGEVWRQVVMRCRTQIGTL